MAAALSDFLSLTGSGAQVVSLPPERRFSKAAKVNFEFKSEWRDITAKMAAK
jgi:hypothetical protein